MHIFTLSANFVSFFLYTYEENSNKKIHQQVKFSDIQFGFCFGFGDIFTPQKYKNGKSRAEKFT